MLPTELSGSNVYCHVCGVPLGNTSPWGADGKNPDFSICECCGVEFGYEDATMASVLSHREKWLNSGANWFSPRAKPANWSLSEQLARLPVIFPAGIVALVAPEA
jgi:hypothetical protein